MADDLSPMLLDLPVWKLKAVANEYRIDVSGCRQKKHYVQKIAAKNLTRDQIMKALGEIKKIDDDQVKREIKAIADKTKEPKDLPDDQELEIGRQIEQSLSTRPAFFSVDSMVEAAHNRMVVGDFLEAIRLNREARMSCLDSFSSFQVYSAALSIKAADELLSRLILEGRATDPLTRSALAEAKKAFIDGPPKRREETLENLEALASKIYHAFLKDSEKEYAELTGLLADYESFGTRTDEARRYLEIAGQARQGRNLAEMAKLLKSARFSAENSMTARVREIGDSYHIVKSAVSEAKDIGVDTTAAEADLERARNSLDEGRFKDALQLMVDTERLVDAAHLEQLRIRKDLEAKQHERVKYALAEHEPTLAEAANYGMDVQDGIRSVDMAKTALGKRDLVNAAKHVRRAEQVAASIAKPLDDKRIELGVMKPVDGVKCGKCGQKSLYALPLEKRKCVECGHTFSLSAVPQPTQTTQPGTQAASSAQKPKKFGFFRW